MNIKIGTSGFSFDDWVGVIYPPGLNRREWLTYYEKELGFSALEINYTYYAMPSVKTLSAMSGKTSPRFEFVIKAHKSMTHELWEDKERTVARDNANEFTAFVESLKPLREENKLTAVLAQFPYFFYKNEKSFDYLARFRDRMGDIPTIIEFRNRAWHGEDAFVFLTDAGLGYCVVDEPKIKGLLPYFPTATTNLAYFRFHGRNPDWYNAPVETRYNYLYSESEIKELLPGILEVAGKVTKTMAFFNNCHAGQAAKNAIELARMLFGEAE